MNECLDDEHVIKSPLAEKTIPLVFFEKLSTLCLSMGVTPLELLAEFYSENIETMLWIAISQTRLNEMTMVEIKCLERLFKSYEQCNASVLNIFENDLMINILRKYKEM